MKICVSTALVIARLEANREEHVHNHALQLEGWKKEMVEFSKKCRAWEYTGCEIGERPVEPLKPESFVQDYDSYLEFLEHHEYDDIELSRGDFKKVFKNEFPWSKTFQTNSKIYC